ncbi:hypothetical protein LCGC14_2339370 [marine sediment metagenome]|uniref:GntR family transcriptional regulator n=1 Tax=marine sediment metagenome TaxID=412755 RepID=A0A0F9CCD0_9ZZZZ
MTIDKLKRVMWRLKEINPAGLYSDKNIRLAIMEECGTDERTIKATINKLLELKLLVKAGFGMLKDNETLTQKDV